MSAEPLVSLRGVSFSYPLPDGASRPALNGVTLRILPGERLVVLGASGAGKSTLAALIAGVARPSHGEIVRPAPPAAGAPPSLAAGYVTQNPEDSFSSPLVREEMGVVLENLQRDPAEIDRAVAAALAEIGLAGHADGHPGLLSGGQKQLLAIASVLIAAPPLLVLDEPLTLLDAPSRAEVDLLLARGPAAATVYLTSEIEETGRGDRVVVLHQGSVAWEGASGDLPRDAATLGAWGLHPAIPPEPPSPAGCALAAPPAIEICGLHFSYEAGTPRERPVLRGVDLCVRRGELLGIVGANGSGKTTLVQHLNGLLPVQRGRIVVGGRVLEPGAGPGRLLYREVGLAFQFPEKQLFAETLDEDVAAGPEFAGVPEAEIPGRARAAMERVGLDPAVDGPRAPFALSWGEKRLAALAGVLVLETPHLALDEPGAGLDPAGRRRVMALLADAAHRQGRTVIVVSHHLDDLFAVADRVAVLHEGRVVFTGTPEEVRRECGLSRWGLARPASVASPAAGGRPQAHAPGAESRSGPTR